MLNEQETKQKAEALRENLRNERRSQSSSGKPSTGAKQNGRGTGEQGRSDSQAFRADSGQSSRNAKDVGSSDRSFESKPERSGQDYGRSLDYGGSTANRSDQATRYSGLERADLPIPEMPVTKRPVGRPRKEQVIDTAAQVKKAIFKKKTTLTEKEADEYKKPLMSALQSYGEYYDKYIRWRTNQPNMSEIWGNLADVEVEALANIAIRRGMKSAHAAETIRNAVNGEDYISVGVMFVPRIMATVEEMKKVPPKQKRGKRREATN